MDDNFEKYMDENRSAFEKGGPSPELWQNLKDKLTEHHTAKRNTKKIWMARWMAAAILLLIAGTAAIVFIPRKPQNLVVRQDEKVTPPVAEKPAPPFKDSVTITQGTAVEKPRRGEAHNSDALPDDDHALQYYQASVKQKEQQLDKLLGSMPELEKDFKHALNDLDLITNELKAALPRSIDKEKIIKGIIKNLQMQESILNSQLQLLKDIQNNNTDDKVHS